MSVYARQRNQRVVQSIRGCLLGGASWLSFGASWQGQLMGPVGGGASLLVSDQEFFKVAVLKLLLL